ncbi:MULTISPECIES: S1C family serine protease [Lactobacillus]|jgi:serine protease Do|uniref:S1C family serine protease n=1 Tax=Lactobacillus TaxID=1578 RepID=UPI001CCB35EF|nr:trypsin-like peptidase domain-containing protein [Lactobacillus amylovorus]MCI1911117.1 trypsin-like peptidase domain-containing protein [Lactobacillus amylovorus]UNL46368.1 PDZ domain-containing protein [Lactobacillus amylovorus]GMM17646.1 trypsin-like peptidase domain-containing protein [Lactobacillus amylovorus]GMM18825.1 trypsin-like peptidase domain-containing protein [Lactobacillus amylovorus]GMM21234.1 trypsin-like peptidase domain-containing protein [Lactobacillus amylovorus]
MTENQNNNSQMPKRRSGNGKIIATAAIVGVVGGLIGGGVSYYAADQMNSASVNNSAAQTSVSSSSSKVSQKSAKTSGTMTTAYNDVKGAVVSVINLKRQSSSSSTDSLYNSLFGDDEGGSSKKNGKLETYSEGSGVVYMKSNGKGYIVTNNHVISGSDAVQVQLANGKTVSAKVVGKDSTTDLAVLSIDAKYVTQTAEFGDSKSLQAGQTVIAVGSPLGSEYASTVTQGIVSAPARTIETSSGNQQTVIQTDAAINPGNSGGALVNSAGQVIGINSMKLAQSSDGTSVEGMGFAIPSNEVVTIVNELVKKGKITRPQLGVRVVALNGIPEAYRSRLKIKSNLKNGIYVASVNKSGSAARAGMKSGDVITAVDGKKVDDVASLHSILYSHKVGDTVNVTVNRNGKNVSLKVKLEGN